MPSIVKPVATHPSLQRNQLGLTIRDYEGSMSTLCAGCGHDSITAALTRALWEADTQPHMIAKLSGIGCSSKTPAYFVNGAHGLNSAHGRMPPIATGANAANRELTYIGISGDGDSLSIGLGHMCHAIRRNVRMIFCTLDVADPTQDRRKPLSLSVQESPVDIRRKLIAGEFPYKTKGTPHRSSNECNWNFIR